MSGAEVVRLHLQLMELTERLAREHQDRLAVGAVVRAVAGARDELRGQAVDAGLLEAVEALARRRLAARPSPA